MRLSADPLTFTTHSGILYSLTGSFIAHSIIGMTDTSVYGGLFQDPPCLSSDPDPKKTDPYDKQDCIPSRYLGRGMTIGHAARGLHADSFFDGKYITLASADQNAAMFAEQDKAARKKRRHRTAPEPKKISDKEFRYSSFPQDSTGPGSYYGCFQSTPYEYMTEPWDDGKRKKRKSRKKAPPVDTSKDHLPNVKTNPSKKGTYGYTGRLLSNEPYNENWQSDNAAYDKMMQKRMKNQPPPPKPMGPAFKLAGVGRRFLDELPGTGAPGVYTEYVPPPVKSKKKSHKREPEQPKPIHEKAFRAGTNPGHGGEQGCINPFPNLWVSPEEAEAMRGRKKNRKPVPPAQERPKGAGEWKPNSFPKTSIISSCLRRFY